MMQRTTPSGYPFGVHAGTDARVWGFRPQDGGAQTQTGRQRLSRADATWLPFRLIEDKSKRSFVATAFEQAIVR